MLFLSSTGVILAEKARACASCGSGGDDPMILYPTESWKAYVGFSRTSDFENIDTQGAIKEEFGPTTRNSSVFALGHSFSPRWFATASAPYIVNKREEYEQSGWGDPSLATRYTAVQQTMAEAWIPQVQLIAGYRSGSATSPFDSEDAARLDVRGTGFAEGRTGIDVWHGMFDWKAGFAQTVAVPFGSRDTEIGEVKAGNTYRTTVSFGYGWTDQAKVIAGVNREQVSQSTLDGDKVANSERLSHGIFASFDFKVERLTMVRLTATRAASILQNRNATRSQAATLALMRSF